MTVEGPLTVLWHESSIAHEPPAGEFEAEWTDRLAFREPHPDCPERVQNIHSIIQHELAEYVTWADVDPATRPQLERVHHPEHVDEIHEFCAAGGGRLTNTTGANEHTYRAARYAAGASIQAAEHALDHDVDEPVYALVRPSGHHAQPAQVDGYCFFNNVAVAAEHALEIREIDRVAVIDWDVHHGNGTQECFYDRDDMLFVSIHNDYWSWDPETHPQNGDVEEDGVGDGEGYNLNIPLPPGAGDRGYVAVFDRIVEPVLESYEPDLLLVSAGQDPGTIGVRLSTGSPHKGFSHSFAE